ncbi:MAG: DNA polymerase IV [Clostridiales bacterium]|nr:DNA polymerase IV [Clostridiales bacterium]
MKKSPLCKSALSVIHIDMDAFYAAVEQRDNPDYRGRPVVVGGSPDGRGVVSTASYEAREFGIHSAMPAAKAKNLCPHAIFMPSNMEKYKAVSKKVRAIFERYTDIIEPISIDEAFLGIEDRDSIEIGRLIKKQIKKELDLTASVGISYNKFLAKLASDMQKPDGFTIIRPEDVKNILPGLPIRKLWGVGKKTEHKFHQLGIFTIDDLLKYDRKFLIERWGNKALDLLKYAQGIDHSKIETSREAKSIGEETTLRENTQDKNELIGYLKMFSKSISSDLLAQDLKFRTVTVKIRYEDFKIITRSKTYKDPLYSQRDLYLTGKDILQNRIYLHKPVRLIGMQVSNLIYPNEPIQITFQDII